MAIRDDEYHKRKKLEQLMKQLEKLPNDALDKISKSVEKEIQKEKPKEIQKGKPKEPATLKLSGSGDFGTKQPGHDTRPKHNRGKSY